MGWRELPWVRRFDACTSEFLTPSGVLSLHPLQHHTRSLIKGHLRASPVAHRLSSHILLWRPRVCWFGSWMQTRHCLVSHAVVGVPHKIEEDGHGYWLRASLPQQKRGGLVANVSSVLIFLKKKKGGGHLTLLLPSLLEPITRVLMSMKNKMSQHKWQWHPAITISKAVWSLNFREAWAHFQLNSNTPFFSHFHPFS